MFDDHTPIDAFLSSGNDDNDDGANRRNKGGPIGRPLLVFLVDQFSGAIVGSRLDEPGNGGDGKTDIFGEFKGSFGIMMMDGYQAYRTRLRSKSKWARPNI